MAADLAVFATLYPDVDNVVGNWQGRLSNRGETIELVDATDQIVDSLRYADQGDWASRGLDDPDHGHQGWTWEAKHDGDGNSLELVNLALSNDHGQNWAASLVSGGTPGEINSVASEDTAPLILAVEHAPILPSSTDNIVVTAVVLDDSATGASAALYFKVDDQVNYQEVRMYDDGIGVDQTASDGVFSALIPAQADRSIVQFFVTAVDGSRHARDWPPIEGLDGNRRPDALLQVLDDAVDPDTWTPDQFPTTYIVMTAAERDELADIGDGPFDEALSNAQMNGTFIRVDGRGTHLRYFVGVRNRGGSSRIGPPNNYRINFAHDHPWDEAIAISLNSLFAAAEIVGNAVYRLAGMPAAVAQPAQVWVNGVNAADPSVPGMSIAYSQLEVINGDFIDRNFPDDPDGNLYRAEAAGTESGDLRYEGPDASAYRDTYSKATNEAEDDWSDLIRLTEVLNNSPDSQFFERVSEVLDVEQWMRFLALDALLGNRETGLSMGTGDNFWLYRGTVDARFKILPHDLDTIMGVGRVAQPNRSIFAYTAVSGLQRLLTHPDTVPLYYRALSDLITQVFNPETMNPLFDQLLQGLVSAEELDAFKQFVMDRVAGVTAQLPQEFIISSPLPLTSGYHRSAQPITELVGTADALRTQSILVDGHVADWSPATREWSLRPQGDAQVETLVEPASDWAFLDDGTELSARWRLADFDDSEWKHGAAPLGYGIRDLATTVGYGPNPNDRFITTYFRHVFDVPDPDSIRDLALHLQRDDGAIIYLNGQEVARSNLPNGEIDFQTVASTWVGGAAHTQDHSFSIDASLLQAGQNILAVEVHQRSAIDNDLWFDLALEAAIGSQTGGVGLRPGINRVVVQAFDGPDGTGNEIDRDSIDIWYDGASGIDTAWCESLRNTTHVASSQLIAGPLLQDTTLAPCGPAYHVTGEIVVPAGITLTVLPGTTVFFDSGAEIRIDGGRLIAEGAPNELIRFTRTVGSNALWNGLQLRDSVEDNRLAYAVIEYAATADGMIGIERSQLTVDHVTFDHSDRFRIRTINSSLVVRNSTFTDIFPGDQPPTTDNRSEHIWGSGILSGGQLLIENNVFGTTKGHNDLVDFDGAERPGPIPVIRNNVFSGSGDDLLDLESDAHIEGNIFQHVAKDAFNTATGDANAISAGGGRHYVVVRNVFRDVDHAVQVKDDAFLTFQHNTVYDAHTSAIYFDLEDRSPGRGARVEDSIIEATPVAFASVEQTTDLQVNRSIVPEECHRLWSGQYGRTCPHDRSVARRFPPRSRIARQRQRTTRSRSRCACPRRRHDLRRTACDHGPVERRTSRRGARRFALSLPLGRRAVERRILCRVPLGLERSRRRAASGAGGWGQFRKPMAATGPADGIANLDRGSPVRRRAHQ